jgi:hypothetical protein
MKSTTTSQYSGFTVCTVLLTLAMFISRTSAQEAAETQSSVIVCTFEYGRQISAHYLPVAASRSGGPSAGKVWVPGGSAIALFTETDLTLGSTSLRTGAYTMYLIAGKKVWTLIVSRNVKINAAYDEHQDLVRAPMATGALDRTEEKLAVFFGHNGPKRCEMNVDYGKTRAWIEFTEK